jgi:hypothetical protein
MEAPWSRHSIGVPISFEVRALNKLHRSTSKKEATITLGAEGHLCHLDSDARKHMDLVYTRSRGHSK